MWRCRAARAHRIIGRIYVPSVLVAGRVVAVLTTAGPLAATSFVLLDLYWPGTRIAGYRAVRARRFRSHERWMRRSFAATFAAVTLRLWLGILIAAQLPLLVRRGAGRRIQVIPGWRGGVGRQYSSVRSDISANSCLFEEAACRTMEPSWTAGSC